MTQSRHWIRPTRAEPSPDNPGMVRVTFDWSPEHGECYDCGLPAAYALDGETDPEALRCSVCAAAAIHSGDAITLSWLFERGCA